MNALISIERPKDSMSNGMLESSLSFLHPMKHFTNQTERIVFKLYDLKDKEEMDDKLNYLSEASSVDFSYRYRLED